MVKRIAILVDNPFRDLPGLALVARYLALQGAACYLVPMNLRESEIWSLAPDLVVLNHFNNVYSDLAKSLLNAGIHIAVLDTEGAIFSTQALQANSCNPIKGNDKRFRAYAFPIIKNIELRHKISCFCAWTSDFASYAAKNGWYDPKCIKVTGAPRIDFYAKKWHQLAKNIFPFANKYVKNLILINSSFPLANPKFQSAEKEVAMLMKLFDYEKEYMDKLLNSQKVAMHELTKLAKLLAKEIPNATFVFRPHPFENENNYIDILSGHPNLHVIKKGTVDSWLLRAKAMIHIGSSSAIESSIANIPSFTPGWLIHFPHLPPIESVSIHSPTKSDMIHDLNSILDSNFSIPQIIKDNAKQVIENTFYKIDGDAHKRVGDALLGAVMENNQPISIDYCQTKLQAISPEQLKKWDRGAKNFNLEQISNIISKAPQSSKVISISDAMPNRDYLFTKTEGRSILIKAC